jgi:SAM-dependent methyltransferase
MRRANVCRVPSLPDHARLRLVARGALGYRRLVLTGSSPFARARAIRAYDHADTLTLLGADGVVRRFSAESAELARAVLGVTASPRTPAELAARLSQLAGAEVRLEGAVAELLTVLEAAGAVERAAPAPKPARAARIRVALGLTGGVAAAFAPALVEQLFARGFDVQVAATRRALRFVGALALEALTHRPLVRSLWPRDGRAPVPHLDLARWAEVFVVYPASATSLARLAQGSCATVVSAAAISTRAPVLLVPAMNVAMFTAPSVQRNLAQLREDGFFIAHPSLGYEVADAPAERGSMLGAAPPIGVVADLVEAIAAHHLPPRPPRWDDAYAAPPQDLPWYTAALDADIAALLDGVARGRGRRLDLGTGAGTAAIAAADRGFSVVATDISPRALALARARAGARPILWLCDDILATELRSEFDVVLDRGLLHALPPARHAAYAAAVAALVAPGGALILKCHAADEPDDHGTHRFTSEEIAALFAGAFDVEHATGAVFPGPKKAPRALLFTLRRRGSLVAAAAAG